MVGRIQHTWKGIYIYMSFATSNQAFSDAIHGDSAAYMKYGRVYHERMVT